MSKDNAKTVASCDNNHDYTAIQKSYNRGFMDKFVESSGIVREGCDPGQVMGYFDGNTVTALWNYAQHFAINDNFHRTILVLHYQDILILFLVKHMEQYS